LISHESEGRFRVRITKIKAENRIDNTTTPAVSGCSTAQSTNRATPNARQIPRNTEESARDNSETVMSLIDYEVIIQ
jgi:hypothetical protein